MWKEEKREGRMSLKVGGVREGKEGKVRRREGEVRGEEGGPQFTFLVTPLLCPISATPVWVLDMPNRSPAPVIADTVSVWLHFMRPS